MAHRENMNTNNQLGVPKTLLGMSPRELKKTIPRAYYFSFWLIPNQIDRSYFVRIINDLSFRFGAPNFEPHVTVYTGICTEKEDIKGVVLGCIAMHKVISLNVKGVACSSNLLKSLYIDFDINPVLSNMHESISEKMKHQEHYELQPHLSLMYKNMTIREKLIIKDQLGIRKSRVTFDGIRVVIPGNPTRGWTDVEKWKTIITARLGNSI